MMLSRASPQLLTNPAHEYLLFLIPGVLFTQFKNDNTGTVTEDNRTFYYANKQGQRSQKLKAALGRVEDTPENRRDMALYVHFSSYGTHSLTEETKALGCDYESETFNVGTFSQMLTLKGFFEKWDHYDKHGYPCKNKLYFPDKPPVAITH